MSVLTGNLSLDLVSVGVALVCVFIAFFKWSFTYWDRRGVPTYPDAVIPFGSIKPIIKREISYGQQYQEYYRYFTSLGEKHGGVYSFAFPIYVPCDLDIIKHILIKDFSNFINRGFYSNEEADPLTGHLFFLEGKKWKDVRAKLTPTFTSGQIKMMFHTLVNCTKGLTKIAEQAENASEPSDIKDILSRFTTDVIANCAFGVEVSCLENAEEPFSKIGKRIFRHTSWESIKYLVIPFLLPYKFLYAIKHKTTKPDVEEFCTKLVNKTVTHREKNNVSRKDFLNLLIQLRNKGIEAQANDDLSNHAKNIQMSIGEITAHVYSFLAAGYETSSNTGTFAIFELSKNQDMQDRLREEINVVLERHNGEYTYEAFMEMKYMEQIIDETLRMYPPLATLNRQVLNDYKVPGTSVTLKKETPVFIPILGIHYDEKYYPNPHQFDPERFNETNRSKIPSCAYLPFGEGPRICIGMRFGYLQTKVGIASLIRNHRITLSEKTELPLRYIPSTLVHGTQQKLLFNFEKL